MLQLTDTQLIKEFYGKSDMYKRITMGALMPN